MRNEIEPYRQGELDSLCGLYAIINAVAALCPEIDGDAAERIFRKLVMGLGEHVTRPVGTLYDGIEKPALEGLLGIAQGEVERLTDIRLRVKPFDLGKRPPLSQVWRQLRAEVGGRQVAILGLSGAHDHWTVAYAVTDKLIRLVDSMDSKALLRARCTTSSARTRFRIDPAAILLVKRPR